MKMIGRVDEKVHKRLKQLSVTWGLSMSDTIDNLLDIRDMKLKENQPR